MNIFSSLKSFFGKGTNKSSESKSSIGVAKGKGIKEQSTQGEISSQDLGKHTAEVQTSEIGAQNLKSVEYKLPEKISLEDLCLIIEHISEKICGAIKKNDDEIFSQGGGNGNAEVSFKKADGIVNFLKDKRKSTKMLTGIKETPSRFLKEILDRVNHGLKESEVSVDPSELPSMSLDKESITMPKELAEKLKW
jgi:hypothetical protein